MSEERTKRPASGPDMPTVRPARLDEVERGPVVPSPGALPDALELDDLMPDVPAPPPPPSGALPPPTPLREPPRAAPPPAPLVGPPTTKPPAARGAQVESGRPPEQPPRRLPTIGTFGPYDIVGRLALGGMAEILLAREESEGAGARYLVVKRILPEYETEPSFVEMFLDEARVGMLLQHPNVCHIYKFGHENGTPFIAMEWVNGASFGKLIRRARRHKGLPPPVVCRIIAAIADALEHAHNATGEDGRPLGIVHRDATPDNIMVSYEGAVKLLDFGIAKAEARAHKTQAGVVKGKFAYMAPEQCRGKSLDRRVDIFALGVCLYEGLTGKPLYRRDTEFETMEAIVRGPVPKLADRWPSAPPELEAIIARCLAKDADERFSTAGELVEALDGYLAKRGEVVSSRRLKELMEELFRDEQDRGPVVDTSPFGSSYNVETGDAMAFGMTQQAPEHEALPMPDFLGNDVLPAPSELEPPRVPSAASRWKESSATGHEAIALAPSVDDGRPGAAHDAAPRHPADRGIVVGSPPRVRDLPPAPAERSTGLLYGGLAVLLLALAGGAAFFFRDRLFPEEREVAEAAPVALEGALLVRTSPEGATVFVDDEDRGVTPLELSSMSTGSHRVRLELEGYEPHEGAVEIRANRTRELEETLTPITEEVADGPTGRLNLTSRPVAEVFLRGESLGRTPLRRLELPAGVVALEFVTPDGERHRRGVVVRAGELSSTELDLSR